MADKDCVNCGLAARTPGGQPAHPGAGDGLVLALVPALERKEELRLFK